MLEEIKSLRQMVSELEGYAVELEERNGELERQLDESRRAGDAASGASSAQAAADASRLERLLERHEEAAAELEEMHARVDALLATNDELSAANATLHETIRRLRAERKGLPHPGRHLAAVLDAERPARDEATSLASSAPPGLSARCPRRPPPPRRRAGHARTRRLRPCRRRRWRWPLRRRTRRRRARRPTAAAAATATWRAREPTPAAAMAAVAPASVAAAAAAAASEAELAQRLSEAAISLGEIGAKDAYEDERARLILQAPRAPDDEPSLRTDAAAAGDDALPAGSYARTATQTHASLASGRLGELTRITDAIRSGRPLHEALADAPPIVPPGGGGARADDASTARFGGDTRHGGARGASDRLLEISNRPIGQRKPRAAAEPTDEDGLQWGAGGAQGFIDGQRGVHSVEEVEEAESARSEGGLAAEDEYDEVEDGPWVGRGIGGGGSMSQCDDGKRAARDDGERYEMEAATMDPSLQGEDRGSSDDDAAAADADEDEGEDEDEDEDETDAAVAHTASTYKPKRAAKLIIPTSELRRAGEREALAARRRGGVVRVMAG